MLERVKTAIVRFLFMLLFIAMVAGVGYAAYHYWPFIESWNESLVGQLRLVVGIMMATSALLAFLLSKEGTSSFGAAFGLFWTVIAVGVAAYFQFIGSADILQCAVIALGSYYLTFVLKVVAQKAG
ncbi:MAG: hypothetical protein WCS88_03530 [Patescibacteria group bacterium]|jgi:hypothetical protein